MSRKLRFLEKIQQSVIPGLRQAGKTDDADRLQSLADQVLDSLGHPIDAVDPPEIVEALNPDLVSLQTPESGGGSEASTGSEEVEPESSSNNDEDESIDSSLEAIETDESKKVIRTGTPEDSSFEDDDIVLLDIDPGDLETIDSTEDFGELQKPTDEDTGAELAPLPAGVADYEILIDDDDDDTLTGMSPDPAVIASAQQLIPELEDLLKSASQDSDPGGLVLQGVQDLLETVKRTARNS